MTPSLETRFGGKRDAMLLTSNALSLGVVACSGIAINVVLARQFGVEVVGQFNQLASLHLVAAQGAAFGIHLSCLHYLSTQTAGTPSWTICCRAALAAVLCTGMVVAGLVAVLAPYLEGILGSQALAGGIYWTAPAVALFAYNKVVQSICNASDRLHVLAVLQALRPVGWLMGIMMIVLDETVNAERLGMIILAGESAAAFLGTAVLLGILRRVSHLDLRGWYFRHLRFGIRAMPSHLITDLNTRLDVLVLALFANDAVVGIYGFVAVLAEGVFQLGVLVRTVVTRRLTRILAVGDQLALAALRQQSGFFSLAVTLVAALALSIGFLPAISWLGLAAELAQGEYPLWVLLVGVIACSSYSPMWMVLLLAGKPIAHTQLMLMLCVVNIALNIVLIPVFGMLGAAIGTAAMFAVFPVLLAWMTHKVIGIRL